MSAKAGSSAAAPSNFGRLLASSRYSGYQPGLHQVYTAHRADQRRGDFGLKRPLPTQHLRDGTIRYVDIEAMDSAKGGQTRWTEKEHEVVLRRRARELRYSRTPEEYDRDRFAEGPMAPRISTTYDPSTYRPVPTHYAAEPNPALRETYEAAAREGKGPVYAGAGTAGSIALRGAALKHSDTLAINVDYQTMDDKAFERFLSHVRERRPEIRSFLASNATLAARRSVALQYERIRDNALKSAEDKESSIIPPHVNENELPLPDVAVDASLQAVDDTTMPSSAFTVDLFDQSRQSRSGLTPLWRLWLAKQKSASILDGESEQLATNMTQDERKKSAPLHPEAGLRYSFADSIQAQLLAEPVPARVLEHSNDGTRRTSSRKYDDGARYSSSAFTVAIGGQFAKADRVRAHNGSLIDWSQNDANRGVTYVKPLWTEEESLRERDARRGYENVSSATPVHGQENRILQVRTVSRDDDDEKSSTTSRLRTNDGIRVPRARGIPGSTRWIAELEGRMGYEPSEGAFGAVDYGDMSSMMGSPRGQEQSSPESRSGGGRGLYSRREVRRAAQQQQQKAADPTLSNRINFNQYADILRLSKPPKKSSENAQEGSNDSNRSD